MSTATARLFHWEGSFPVNQADTFPTLADDMDDAGATAVRQVLVTGHESITIRFDYPLQRPVTFTFESAGGFTLADLFRCVHEGYTRIYASEPLEYCPGVSTGPYGIWGHDIGSLFVESIDEIEPAVFELGIGS